MSAFRYCSALSVTERHEQQDNGQHSYQQGDQYILPSQPHQTVRHPRTSMAQQANRELIDFFFYTHSLFQPDLDSLMRLPQAPRQQQPLHTSDNAMSLAAFAQQNQVQLNQALQRQEHVGGDTGDTFAARRDPSGAPLCKLSVNLIQTYKQVRGEMFCLVTNKSYR